MRICLKDAPHRSCGKIFRVRVGTSKICDQNVNPSWILLQQETMEVAVTAGNTQFFLKAGCPSSCPLDAIKANKRSEICGKIHGSWIQDPEYHPDHSQKFRVRDPWHKKSYHNLFTDFISYPAQRRRNNNHKDKETTCQEHAWKKYKGYANCAVYVYKE